MSALALFDPHGHWLDTHVCEARIGDELRRHGLDFGRWEPKPLADEQLHTVLAGYSREIEALGDRIAVCGVERLRLPRRQAPRWRELRRLYAIERVQSVPEIHYFLNGIGLFCIRSADGYLGLLCEAHDWLWVPAGKSLTFDAGAAPHLDVLHLLAQPRAAASQPTGLARPPLPQFDDFVEHLLDLSGASLE